MDSSPVPRGQQISESRRQQHVVGIDVPEDAHCSTVAERQDADHFTNTPSFSAPRGEDIGLSPQSSDDEYPQKKMDPDAIEGGAEDAPRPLISKLKTQSAFSPNRPSPALPRQSATFTTAETDNGVPSGKEKKKAVSFFSRLLPNNKKRSSTLNSHVDLVEDDAKSEAARRQDSMDSPLAVRDIDNIEYAPRVLQPSSYAKVKFRNKKDRDLDRLFLAQELHPAPRTSDPSASRTEKGKAEDQDAIWALGFSKDGRYLASAGQDSVLRIWTVLSNPEEREDPELERSTETLGRPRFKALVFKSTPAREYADHEGAILDISWSKNNFLLTTSLDKTIRLYHPSRPECLCTFKHSSAVPAIAFHPRDDRFFLAGSKDAKLRFWSIPDKRVEFWANVQDVITAVTFSPDGKHAIAGTMGGNVNIYQTDALKYIGQFPVRGKRKSRVTVIEARYIPEGSDIVKLLITSADSRIGIYNLRDKALEIKLKAHKAEELSIRASFSEDGKRVISGSEDKQAYIWSIAEGNGEEDKDRDKTLPRPVESFEASGNSKVNCAIFAPRETRIVLSASEDPIYDICNPPPVRLVEREGSVASSSRWTDHGSTAANGGHKRSQSRQTISQAPISTSPHKGDETPRSATFPEGPLTSSAYHIRSVHNCGPIVVTASLSGIISVFRQDCAFRKRKSFDISALEGSVRKLYLRRALGSGSSRSSVNSPNLNNGPLQPRKSYTGSIASFRTGPTHSIKSSAVTQGDHRGELVARSRRSESNASQPTRDRIERWREGIDARASTSSLRGQSTQGRMSESLPPSRNSQKSAPIEGEMLNTNKQKTPILVRSKSDADSGHETMSEREIKDTSHSSHGNNSPVDPVGRPDEPRRNSSYANPLRLTGGQGGQSFMFWNTSQHTPKPEAAEPPFPQLGEKISKESMVSRLTSEECNAVDEEEEAATAALDSAAKCARCGFTKYKVKDRGWGFGKNKSVVCARCGWEQRGE